MKVKMACSTGKQQANISSNCAGCYLHSSFRKRSGQACALRRLACRSRLPLGADFHQPLRPAHAQAEEIGGARGGKDGH